MARRNIKAEQVTRRETSDKFIQDVYLIGWNTIPETKSDVVTEAPRQCMDEVGMARGYQ